jgi:hypothetical protein
VERNSAEAFVTLQSRKETFMPKGDVTDSDVALLCDIGGGLDAPLESSRLARVMGLIAMGLLRREPEARGGGLRLTEKGQDVLAERGVGINEA